MIPTIGVCHLLKFSYLCMALEKEVAVKVLEALEEISALPSFSTNSPMKFSLADPWEDNTFQATIATSIICCY